MKFASCITKRYFISTKCLRLFPILVDPVCLAINKDWIIYLSKYIEMPSTLYQSVKNSVIEYAQIKKRNERKQDKLLFKWKLITLLLAIVLIVLIGVFSQLLQSINNIPDITADKTYIVPMMKQLSTQSVQTLTQANNLIAGITVSSDSQQAFFEWNDASQLYFVQGSLSLADLITSINNNEELVFIFIYVYNASYTARFGLRAHRGYNQADKNGDTVIVQDQPETRYSSIFNINNGKSFSYDVSECDLFSRTSSSLTIFESITFTEVAGNTGLTFNVLKPSCFSTTNPQDASSLLANLTGMDSTPVTDLSVFGLEVYTLWLKEQQQNEM